MSLDFIPVEHYEAIFNFILLLLIVLNYAKLQHGFASNDIGVFLVFFFIIYIGLRPINGSYFGDTGTYNSIFIDYQEGGEIKVTTDLVFHQFMKLCSGIMSANFFFLTCAFLYIYPLYLVCKKWFKNYWFYGFLLLVSSFSFWAYATNGIRNGIAGSLFLFAISRDKRIWQIAFLFIAISFHKSILLPTLGFIIAQFYNKPRQLILFWLLCIPLSLAAGGFWETLFASLEFDDDRTSYLTAGNLNDDEFSSTGFRWDFLVYSASAIYAGWYFIVKKKFEDKIYNTLFITYVFANAFWVLVIRANFSNRFAYLSWFMMALVIVYPFLRSSSMKYQSRVFAKVLILYFLFTFIMNVILSKK